MSVAPICNPAIRIYRYQEYYAAIFDGYMQQRGHAGIQILLPKSARWIFLHPIGMSLRLDDCPRKLTFINSIYALLHPVDKHYSNRTIAELRI